MTPATSRCASRWRRRRATASSSPLRRAVVACHAMLCCCVALRWGHATAAHGRALRFRGSDPSYLHVAKSCSCMPAAPCAPPCHPLPQVAPNPELRGFTVTGANMLPQVRRACPPWATAQPCCPAALRGCALAARPRTLPGPTPTLARAPAAAPRVYRRTSGPARMRCRCDALRHALLLPVATCRL